MEEKKNDQLPPLNKIEILFLSGFGIGFAKYMPGTFASLVMVPILGIIGKLQIPSIIIIPALVVCIVGACLVTEFVQQKYKIHDPSWIVIDEVIGMVIAWSFWPSPDIVPLLVCFALFRFFDIVKVWPASFFDRKVSHGYGTIMDDIISGIYAGIGLLLFKYFLSVGMV